MYSLFLFLFLFAFSFLFSFSFSFSCSCSCSCFLIFIFGSCSFHLREKWEGWKRGGYSNRRNKDVSELDIEFFFQKKEEKK